jgi:hypothetical protein
MGIDRQKFRSPAIKGDVSGVAIECLTGFLAIANALSKLQRGEKAIEEIRELQTSVKRLNGLFEELTGWTEE